MGEIKKVTNLHKPILKRMALCSFIAYINKLAAMLRRPERELNDKRAKDIRRTKSTERNSD